MLTTVFKVYYVLHSAYVRIVLGALQIFPRCFLTVAC